MDPLFNPHRQICKNYYFNLSQKQKEIESEMKRIGSRLNHLVTYYKTAFEQLSQESEIIFFAKYKSFYQEIICFKKYLFELNYAGSQLNLLYLPSLFQSK